MKIIASSVRKGNVLEVDGKLYVVLSAESFFPGKGTPTTQIDMRRISDGVKNTERYRTTEQVERATVEEREHQFLYQDGDGFHFMNMENYDQVFRAIGHFIHKWGRIDRFEHPLLPRPLLEIPVVRFCHVVAGRNLFGDDVARFDQLQPDMIDRWRIHARDAVVPSHPETELLGDHERGRLQHTGPLFPVGDAVEEQRVLVAVGGIAVSHPPRASGHVIHQSGDW